MTQVTIADDVLTVRTLKSKIFTYVYSAIFGMYINDKFHFIPNSHKFSVFHCVAGNSPSVSMS